MAQHEYQFRGTWEPNPNLDGWTLQSERGAVLDASCGEWLLAEQGARLDTDGNLADASGAHVAQIA